MKIKILTRKQKLFLYASLILLGILLFFRLILGAFLFAFIIAYLLDPFLDYAEKKGISRSLSAFLILFAFFTIIGILLYILVPIATAQFKELLNQIPIFRDYLEQKFFPSLVDLVKKITGKPNIASIQMIKSKFSIEGFIPDISTVVNSVGKSTKFVLSFFFMLILSPAFAFFLLRDLRKLIHMVLSLIPPDLRPSVKELALDVNSTLRAVIRGQLLVISLLSTLYASAFMLCEMPLGFIVGIITGCARLIPYMDILVGSSLSFLILATSSDTTFSTYVLVAISFVCIQIFDAFFLTPRIMGQYSGVHPFIIIISVICLSDWFGFFGILLAIPSLAVSRVLLKHAITAYKNSHFFLNQE